MARSAPGRPEARRLLGLATQEGGSQGGQRQAGQQAGGRAGEPGQGRPGGGEQSQRGHAAGLRLDAARGMAKGALRKQAGHAAEGQHEAGRWARSVPVSRAAREARVSWAGQSVPVADPWPPSPGPHTWPPALATLAMSADSVARAALPGRLPGRRVVGRLCGPSGRVLGAVASVAHLAGVTVRRAAGLLSGPAMASPCPCRWPGRA